MLVGMSERDWNWARQLQGIVPPLISPLDDAGATDAGPWPRWWTT
jgi:hypothetical protein